MKNFCKNLKDHATKIINYEKKEMPTLTKEVKNYTVNRKFATFAKKNLAAIRMITKIVKLDHCHYTGK